MKKFFKSLSLVFLLSLFSIFIVRCGKEEKPSKEEIIERFVENSKNIKSAAFFSKIIMKEDNINDIELNMEATVIAEPFNMKISTTIPVHSQKMQMYIKEEYVYIFNPVTNQWNKYHNKELNDYVKKSLDDSNEIYDILKNNMDKISLEEEKDYYSIKITEGTSLFKDAIKKQLVGLKLEDKNIFDNLPIENLLLSYVIDKKTYLPISSYNEFDIRIEGSKKNMSIETKFENINKIKKIKLPKEALEAIEI